MAKRQEAPRRTLDTIMVQAHLAPEETYTLRELAHHVFERTSPVCVARIQNALHLLQRMGRVSLKRASLYSITEARATSAPIVQVDACFFLMVYRALNGATE